MEDIRKKRIEWIDAMRGFTMILVVFNHLEHFGYGYISNTGDLRLFFGIFRMPLFFFVSGFIAYKIGQILEGKEYYNAIIKKAKVQLIPTFVFGILFSVTIYAAQRGYANPFRGVASMIIDSSKNGYWFTIVLFEIFVIYYTIIFLLRDIKHHKYINKTLVILALVFWILSYHITNDNIVNNGEIALNIPTFLQVFINVFCLNRTFFYFQWFVFGNIVARNRTAFFYKLDNATTLTISLLLFFATYIVYKTTGHYIVNCITKTGLGYLGVIIVFGFFYKNQNLFNNENIVGRGLQYIGKRTLDVYLLHFFMIPSLPMVGQWFLTYTNYVLEFTVGMAISVLVIIICLLISNILRLSPLLGHYLFGAKKTNI